MGRKITFAPARGAVLSFWPDLLKILSIPTGAGRDRKNRGDINTISIAGGSGAGQALFRSSRIINHFRKN